MIVRRRASSDEASARSSRAQCALALVLAAATVACGEPAEDPARASLPSGAPIEIDPAASVSIGESAADSDHELFRVVTPFLLPDGNVAVPLAQEGEIRVFGVDGRFLRRLGRAGEGPGEFGDLGSAWAKGDTIEAFDSDLARITRFLPDGSVDVVKLVEPPRSAQTALPGTLPDGWLVAGVAVGEVPGRDMIAVHRFTRDGAHAGEIATTHGIVRYRAPGISGPEPLSPRAVVRLHDGELYIGETLTPAIDIVSPEGAPVRRITWESETPASPGAALAAVTDTAIARAAPERVRFTRLNLEAAPVPEALSVFWSFLVDAQGFVWVRPYEPVAHAAALGGLGRGSYIFGGGAAGGRWSILAPDGTPAGSVVVPDGLELVQITNDAVVGIRLDSLGVESVQVHALTRRSP